MFWYGHPLIDEGAGRIKTDPLNEQRIETVLNRYEEWSKKNNNFDNLKYTIDSSQLRKSAIVFPLAGFAV